MTPTTLTISSSNISNDKRFQSNRELTYKIEQETQQLEALKSTLKQCNDLSFKASTMLTNFDDQLMKLENSILPIHETTQQLKRRVDNVERTKLALEATMVHLDCATKYEPIVLAGPKKKDKLNEDQAMSEYLEALELMLEAKKGLEKTKLKATLKPQEKLTQVLKAAMQHLLIGYKTQLETISKPKSKVELESSLDNKNLNQLLILEEKEVINCVETLKLLDRIEQSLPQQAKVQPEKVIASVRSNYLLESLNYLVKSSQPNSKENFSSGSTYLKGSCPFINYTKVLLSFLTLEQKNLKLLAPNCNFQFIYTETIQLTLKQYIEILENLILYSKKDLHNEIFLLFDILENLIQIQPKMKEIYQLTTLTDSSILNSITSISNLLMKSFPAFLEDIQSGIKQPTTLSSDGTVHEMTSGAINFIKRLLEYPETIETTLTKLGLQHSCLQQMDTNINSNNFSLRQLYFNNVLEILLHYIEVKSKGYKNFTLKQIFLLNNYYYIQKALNTPLLKETFLEKKFKLLDNLIKKAMDGYHASWKACFESLTETNPTRIPITNNNTNNTSNIHLSSSDKSNIKERFKLFNQQIEELSKIQKHYTISDPELKSIIIEQILKVLLPLYLKCLERYQFAEFSKNNAKYILYDKHSLTKLVNSLFGGSQS